MALLDFQPRRLLAVVAHPEDAEFDAGGWLAALIAAGTQSASSCSRMAWGSMDATTTPARSPPSVVVNRRLPRSCSASRGVSRVVLAAASVPTDFALLTEPQLQKKIAALRVHESQMAHADVESFVRARAESSAEDAREAGVDCTLADAFALVTLPSRHRGCPHCWTATLRTPVRPRHCDLPPAARRGSRHLVNGPARRNEPLTPEQLVYSHSAPVGSMPDPPARTPIHGVVTSAQLTRCREVSRYCLTS